MSLKLGILSSSIQSGGGVNPVTVAFESRITAAGGTLTNNEKNAVNTLVNTLQADGIWNLMKAIYPMVGASAASCAQNLVSNSFTGTFNIGWTFTSNGAKPNGTSSYMDTNLNPGASPGIPANLLLDSTHMSVYSRTNTTTSASIVEMGCLGTSNLYLIIKFDGATYLSVNNNVNPSVPTISDTRGFFQVSRTSASLTKMYANNTINGTSTELSTTLNTNTIYLGAYLTSSFPQYFSSKEYAFASIGLGLNDTQASNFYNAVQTFQTTLGRQV